MNVLFVSSEVAPFAKTGGLADVSGALPRALAAQGHDVLVVMPYYRHVRENGHNAKPIAVQLRVPVGSRPLSGGALEGTLPGGARTLFVDCPEYFDREGVYNDEDGRGYADNCQRFIWLSRAALEAARAVGFAPDIIRANDWQTSLVPVYARLQYGDDPRLNNAATLITVHNLAHQGIFWHWAMPLTGLPWAHFNWQEFEFYGKLNLLKGGLVYADGVTTVSPTYAREIVRNETMGCGLDGVLRDRADSLWGIVNGIDVDEWNPATDPHLRSRFTAADRSGKAACKAALQEEFGLPNEADAPLIGMVTRLDAQKGIDLVLEALGSILLKGCQFVVLGTGHPRYQDAFAAAQKRSPGQVGVRLQYNDALAHRIEAGADLFLMPSRFEPCGLSQLHSLRYGTVPVVRATGGLADTIVDADAESLAGGRANGFRFGTFSAQAMMSAVDRAVAAYRQPDVWQQIVTNGMAQDWSWDIAALHYEALYTDLVRRRSEAMVSHGI